MEYIERLTIETKAEHRLSEKCDSMFSLSIFWQVHDFPCTIRQWWSEVTCNGKAQTRDT